MQNLKTCIRHASAFIKAHALMLFSSFAMAMTVAYIVAVCSCDIAVQVEINGTDYGYINSANTVMQATTDVGNDIYKATGGDYDTNIEISYDFDAVSNPSYITHAELENILWSYCEDDFCEAYMLYVDDVRAAACESGDELYLLLDEIREDLLDSVSEQFGYVKFSNRLRIEKQLCKRSMLKSIDAINELLNPLMEEQRTSLANSYAAKAPIKEGIIRGISAFSAAAPGMSDLLVTTESTENHELVLQYSFANTVTVEEAIPFSTVYADDDKNFIGTETLSQMGSDGLKSVTYEVLYDEHGAVIGKNKLTEEIIIEPSDRVILVGTREIPKSEPVGSFIWPCDAPKGVSSYYGWRDLYGKADFHLGIDIPDQKGSSIWAADGGTVIWAGSTPSYGNSVKIQHGNKITVYAHLDKILVGVNDKVYQGQKIGTMGNTGVAYGTHLHFEIRINNLTVDPMKYLP